MDRSNDMHDTFSRNVAFTTDSFDKQNCPLHQPECVIDMGYDQEHSRDLNPLEIELVRSENRGKGLCRNQTWKDIIKEKQLSYLENFSMHGLSKACKGNTYERVLWTIVVLLATFGICFMSYRFLVDYTKMEVRTEVRYKPVDALPLPSITVCLYDLTRYGYMICHNNETLVPTPKALSNYTLCPLSTNESLFDINFTYYNEKAYSRETTKTCRTFNANGTLNQTGIGISLILDIKSYRREQDKFQFFFADKVHNHTGMASPELRNGQLYRPGEYKIHLERREVNRLQHPFPSNCTNGENEDYQFSTEYTRMSCYEACLVKEMYERCGDVVDWWKPYLKPEWVPDKLTTNTSDQKQCLIHYQKQLYSSTPLKCGCPLACKEVAYRATFFRSYHAEPFDVLGYHSWKFEMSYTLLHNITITEEELYSLKNLAADIGAVLGLLSGTSILSILEIIVCLGFTLSLICKGK